MTERPLAIGRGGPPGEGVCSVEDVTVEATGEVTASRSRLLLSLGLGWGRGRSPNEASSYRISLSRSPKRQQDDTPRSRVI